VPAPSEGSRAAWVDPALYPFESRWLDLGDGRMHYLDEGAGRPVVFVHGGPSWSFLWREPIRALRSRLRCIAPDLLGFGLSEPPAGCSYRPQEQASSVAALLQRLDVRDATLVVHDWGGPIGLSFALEHPDRVRDLVLFNTWLWSVRGSARGELTGRLFASRPWAWLERRFSLSARFFLPGVMGDPGRLAPEVHRHYLEPFRDPRSREPNVVLWREILGASGWLASLWERRATIAAKPALVVWGLADPAFTPADLARWREALPHARVEAFPRAGHFVQEEEPEAVVRLLAGFLGVGAGRGSAPG
jgi:haloalkane dehalogenase